MVAIGIRDDETRSDLHRNFIQPYTTKSFTRLPGENNALSDDGLDEKIDDNNLNHGAEKIAGSSPRWKFENYQIDNWDSWKDIPFHLKDGEDTSKYFR